MPGSTSRLTMPLPLGADAVSELRLAITAIANTLDTAALARSGTLAARPAANTLPPDTLYRCTDTPAWYVNDGSVWHYLPLDGNSQPVGVMTQYAGTLDPVDPDGVVRWLLCDGRTIAAASYPTLFTRIGVTYGGNSSNFAIPDLRGRVATGPDSMGTGTGAASRLHAQTISGVVNGNALGNNGGADTETLVQGETPLHSHFYSGQVQQDGANHTHGLPAGHTFFTITNAQGLAAVQVAGSGPFASGTGTGNFGVPTNNNNPWGSEGGTATASANHTHNYSGTTNNFGSSGPHNNMTPYLVVNHVIKVL